MNKVNKPESVEGIYGFRGPFRFLSNFWPTQIIYNGLEFPSVEHAYQAAKCKNIHDQEKFLDITPGQAKRLGRKIEIRQDWEEIKLNIMEELVWKKFNKNKELREMLLNTGDKYLEESNNWSDFYWGVCNGKGENHLGKILMKVRQEIIDKNNKFFETYIEHI